MRYVFTDTFILSVRSRMVLIKDVSWSLRTHGKAISEASELAIISSFIEGLVQSVREYRPYFSTNHDWHVDPHWRIRRHIREDEAKGVVSNTDRHWVYYRNGFLLRCNKREPLHGPMSAKLWFKFNRIFSPIHVILVCESTINAVYRE